MRTLALALLIPVAICTGCSSKDDSPAVPESSAPASAPAAAAPEAMPTPAAGAPDAGAAGAAPQTTATASLTPAAGSSAKGDLTLTSDGLAVQIQVRCRLEVGPIPHVPLRAKYAICTTPSWTA